MEIIKQLVMPSLNGMRYEGDSRLIVKDISMECNYRVSRYLDKGF